jgi:site-specific DNA-methyltransferase (adenine-specific)
VGEATEPEPAMIELHRGDCLEVMRDIVDASVDLILTDLPYGSTRCQWDQIIPLEPLWSQYKRIIKPRGAVVLTASQPFTSILVMSNLEWFRHEWVWIKNRGSNFANTCREPMKEHEVILCFSSGGWSYNPQMQERTSSGTSRAKYKYSGNRQSKCYGEMPNRSDIGVLRGPSSWQKFNCEVGFHPTQKPVALMEYMINTYTNEDETVLDSCMGSGTTGVACLNTGRAFIGIEKDPEIFATAERRIAAELNKTPLLTGS